MIYTRNSKYSFVCVADNNIAIFCFEAEASVVSNNFTFLSIRPHTVFFKPSKEILSKI